MGFVHRTRIRLCEDGYCSQSVVRHVASKIAYAVRPSGRRYLRMQSIRSRGAVVVQVLNNDEGGIGPGRNAATIVIRPRKNRTRPNRFGLAPPSGSNHIPHSFGIRCIEDAGAPLTIPRKKMDHWIDAIKFAAPAQ